MNEAKQVEMVLEALRQAKDIIALVYKPDDEPYTSAVNQITDEKIKDYYFTINEMCCELTDRGVMKWQEDEQIQNER